MERFRFRIQLFVAFDALAVVEEETTSSAEIAEVDDVGTVQRVVGVLAKLFMVVALADAAGVVTLDAMAAEDTAVVVALDTDVFDVACNLASGPTQLAPVKPAGVVGFELA